MGMWSWALAGAMGLAAVSAMAQVVDVVVPEAVDTVLSVAPEGGRAQGEGAPVSAPAEKPRIVAGVVTPEVYSVLGREVSALEERLTLELADALADAERSMLDLDVPLPETGDLVRMQMDIDERFGRLGYMARAMRELAQVEAARNEYLEARYKSGVDSLRRVAQGREQLKVVRDSEPVGLDLVAVVPGRIEVLRQPGVYAVEVASVGREVLVASVRVGQPVRGEGDGKGLLIEEESCTVDGRHLRLGDRCTVVLSWDGIGSVPEGVVVVEVRSVGAGLEEGGAEMVQNHVVAFGFATREAHAEVLREEVARIDEARGAELEGIRAEFEGRLAESEEEKAALAAQLDERREAQERLRVHLTEVGREQSEVRGRVDEVVEGSEAKLVELEDQVVLLQGRLNELETTGMATAVVSAAEGPEAEAIAALHALVERMAARLEAVEEGATVEEAGVEVQWQRSLPERVHVVSASGIGAGARAVIQVAAPESTRFEGGRMRVGVGDAVGSGWKVTRVDTPGRRVMLEHPRFGEGVGMPRVFLPEVPELPGELLLEVPESGFTGTPQGALPVVPMLPEVGVSVSGG